MKILDSNAGPLTNYEVLNFLRSKGASNDPTRVLANVSPSEYKVYDYLVETAACNQTEEHISEFVEKCKKYNLAKAEVLNIIHIRPSDTVGIFSMIEKIEERLPDGLDGELVELVVQVLPPPPTQPTNTDDKPTETS